MTGSDPAALPALLLAGAALLALVAAALAVSSGARLRLARRFAGARRLRVAELLALESAPRRAVRVRGRVRCPDPLVTDHGERVVLLEQTVEVEADGRWHPIERRRESRDFDLWDHGGAVRVEPASVAEPLITIPHVWRGSPEELPAAYRPALATLAARHGPPGAARAATRAISIVDQVEVLAAVRRREGAIRLQPPPGGMAVTNLELDTAMRVLGGRRPRRLRAAIVAALGAIGLLVVAVATGATIMLLGDR